MKNSKKKPELKTISYVRQPDGSAVLFDSLPEEEKKRVAESINRRSLEEAARCEGFKVVFDEGTA